MRRRKRRSRLIFPLFILVVVIGGGWWLWRRAGAEPPLQMNAASGEPRASGAGESPAAAIPEAVVAEGMIVDATTDEVLTPLGPDGPVTAAPEAAPDASADATDQEDAARLAQVPKTEGSEPPARTDSPTGKLSRNPRIDASLRRYQAGQVIEARQELNRMLAISRDRAEQAELRQHLAKIADATVFSPEQRADDPLIATYTIQPGDVLINIGRQFAVPHEVIMMINGIKEPTRIRAGQQIKVPRGPFHAKIYKSAFRLDVYLQDLCVRTFPVALGAERGTPEGEWKVKERLPNPTYYPPASAPGRRIIPPDDPSNPLGEHWIGLEGTEGDAVGREGYGIHGTIEPELIGRAVSLGCVRMHNDDVAFLYGLLLPGQSTVTILP